MMSESQYGPSQWSLQDSLPMYIAEFLGTLMYTMTISIVKSNKYEYEGSSLKTVNPELEAILMALSVGFILVSMVYAFGHISGAHFNPAVTLSVWIRGFISPNDAILFVFIQCLGAICGAFLAYAITGAWPGIEPSGNVWRAFAAELAYTFTLCIVVINVATTESQRGNFFYGVAIGLSLSVGTATVGTISGGAFNPAIGTALTITNVINGKTGEYIWIYWVAPLLGGMLGGLSFYVINSKEALHKQYGDQY